MLRAQIRKDISEDVCWSLEKAKLCVAKIRRKSINPPENRATFRGGRLIYSLWEDYALRHNTGRQGPPLLALSSQLVRERHKPRLSKCC